MTIDNCCTVISCNGLLFSNITRLFPLREPGVNYMASELTKKEIEVSLYIFIYLGVGGTTIKQFF